MNHETAVSKAKEIADRILAPAARQNDKDARFSSEAVAALGPAGLLGIMLPTELGGSALGPRTFATVVATLAEADASAAMVYLMHMCATATIAAARRGATVAQILRDISVGRHLTTLAFSEAGSRSHFWAPLSRAKLNGANVRLTAKKSWVTSAGHAQSYVVSALAPDGAGPTDSTLYLFTSDTPGLSVAGPWDGLGMRANASAPMILEDCEVEPGLQLTDDGAGFKAMLEIVLPLFNLGTSAVALGLCRAAVAGTAAHLNSARFEHLGQTLGESLPTLRAQLATTTISSITSSTPGRPRCCVCSRARPRQAILPSPSPRRRCVRAEALRFPSIWPSSDCSAMLMRALSWRRRATFCASSSAKPFWEYRCSEQRALPRKAAVGRRLMAVK